MGLAAEDGSHRLSDEDRVREHRDAHAGKVYRDNDSQSKNTHGNNNSHGDDENEHDYTAISGLFAFLAPILPFAERGNKKTYYS